MVLTRLVPEHGPDLPGFGDRHARDTLLSPADIKTARLNGHHTMFRHLRFLLSIILFIAICKISQVLSEKGTFSV